MDSGMAFAFVREGMMRILLTVAPFFIVGVIVAILVSLVQVGWQPTSKPMKPKPNKISPKSGFKRIFSTQSLFELIKSIVRILLVAYIAYSSIRDYQDILFLLYDIPLRQVITLVGTIVIDTGLRISLVYLLVGIADLVYQRLKFKKEMKMTKQEVKDEMKNTEGNPEIKGRQRSRMREVSQRRMMQNLPKADVVITNPTHLSVAIKYDAETGSAPVVIAKGQDYIAMKIREEAKAHKIEIVENKPLAQMLYANVEIDQEIPPELYQAVAEVLAYVYSLEHM
jgi:flagellar biosynthetic protein FlhB